MNKTKRQARIKDIAAHAGVSAGTVDRVLHGRGRFSQESKEKIEKAVRDLQFKPNMYASALVSKRKEHRFVYLTPKHGAGDYWDYVESGILRAAAEFAFMNVHLEPVYFDQFSVDTFNEAVKRVLEAEPQGVLFTPVFRAESLQLVGEFHRKSIPYVFFDSNLDEAEPLAYYGQDSFAGGYLACKLVSENIPRGSEILLFHSHRKDNRRSNQFVGREQGFMRCSEHLDRDCSIRICDLPIQDEAEAKRRIGNSFEKYPDVNGAVVFNSRGYLLGEYVERASLKNICVVGFDDLRRNVECLKRGSIRYLIGQHPALQGYRSVKALCEAVVLKHKVKRINFMPLDILNAENIDYYTDFNFT